MMTSEEPLSGKLAHEFSGFIQRENAKIRATTKMSKKLPETVHKVIFELRERPVFRGPQCSYIGLMDSGHHPTGAGVGVLVPKDPNERAWMPSRNSCFGFVGSGAA